MTDPRFNSIHLETQPRREDYRRARERLFAMCGMRTLAIDHEVHAEEGVGHPHTVIDNLDRDQAPPPGVTFWLVDKDGLYPLKPGLNSIGRMPDNDVVIADGSVSRRHCAVVVHVSRGCEVHDTASKNGTFLNGKRISGPTKLKNGDEIRMCDRSLTFHSSDAHADEMAPTLDG